MDKIEIYFRYRMDPCTHFLEELWQVVHLPPIEL